MRATEVGGILKPPDENRDVRTGRNAGRPPRAVLSSRDTADQSSKESSDLNLVLGQANHAGDEPDIGFRGSLEAPLTALRPAPMGIADIVWDL